MCKQPLEEGDLKAEGSKPICMNVTLSFGSSEVKVALPSLCASLSLTEGPPAGSF